tara:strand:- start:853 stop:966 length:114 start_codon:yes stop_codon:yes gene_type:complete
MPHVDIRDVWIEPAMLSDSRSVIDEFVAFAFMAASTV